jgi:diadenosine tetraphosphate (Ap4A) HIT family hydrolase
MGWDMQKIEDEHCELCGSPGGELIWENALCRVVSVAEQDYPGFCRVILNRHAREMTDLPADERQQLMNVVFAVEAALRQLYEPDKINLASFGNITPHIHWHIIPRWDCDRHFPHSVWGTAQRVNTPTRSVVGCRQLCHAIVAALGPV